MKRQYLVALFASTCLMGAVGAWSLAPAQEIDPANSLKAPTKASTIHTAPTTSAATKQAVQEAPAGQAAPAGVEIVADDIGGVVKGAKGPEAGVWVIAETTDLPTKYAKMVVTDDQGRYVIPELPKAKYRVWVRGYGLIDSEPVMASPGMAVNLTASIASDAKAAADYYPSSYWYSLIQPPAADQFPGTGKDGNGINPEMKTQQAFFSNMKENCEVCHQIGDMATRDPTADNSAAGWAAHAAKNPGMNNNFTKFGRPAALKMFGDWTNRIAEGQVPPAPPRPSGVERNVVITVRDWANGRSIHDEASTDHRYPTVNGGGPIYGMSTGAGILDIFDPKTNTATTVEIPKRDSTEHNPRAAIHTDTMDQKGRVWMADVYREGAEPDYCTNPSNSYAKFFTTPDYSHTPGQAVMLDVYDPATKKVDVIPTCVSGDHLNMDRDKDNTIYFSSGLTAMGWFDTKVWDETHDASKAEGWCPMTIDTNGNGKIDPGETNWNNDDVKLKPNNGLAGSLDVADPKKDTLVRGFIYGVGVSPKDHSVWGADYIPYVPGALIRMDRGAHPPETCHVEYYEPPLVKGRYLAFNPRGVDVDSDGIAWVSFASGHLGRFDRTKCKVLNGPTATGQQCQAGWKIYDLPSPKITGTDLGSDHLYASFIDTSNVLGLGKDIPMFPGTNSDAIIAFLPKEEKFVNLRVPYPMGFYTRGLDARIDDPKAGWKGRSLWASYSEAMQHQETGSASTHLANFQLRPNPLAH